MVVADVEPLGLLVLVRLYQLVGKVLVGGVFTHLDVGTSDYSWIIGTRLWLQPEKLTEQNLVGLDIHERFAEMHKDRDVEDVVGVEIQVLNVVVLKQCLEEFTSGECLSTLHELGEHWDFVRVLIHWVRINGGGAPYIHLLIAKESTAD
jgi:hypothetical protein